MNITKILAAVLLMEFYLASKPFAVCLPKAEMVKETKLLLSYSGWKDILGNVKTKTAEGEFGDDDVAKLVDQNEDINKENIVYLVNHIFLMLNCRYSSRLLFMSTIVNDLETVCGYFAGPIQLSSIPVSPLNSCEETLLTTFKLISIDFTYALSALMYFHRLSSKKIATDGIRTISTTFKGNYERLLVLSQQTRSPVKIRAKLLSTVNALKTFNDNLYEYFNQNCHVETGYPDTWTIYRFELYELKEQSNLHQLLDYLQMKIIQVSDDITENNFRACGFLYHTDTRSCTINQPQTST